MIRFAEKLKVLPILGVNDIAATTVASQYVDLKAAHWVTFLVSFGDITNVSATVTVEASTAASSNATEAAIPFTYRLSSPVATDSMGAITAATSSGVALATTDDNSLLVIDVDPAALNTNPGADYRFLRLVVAASTANTVTDVGAVAIFEPRYPGNSIASAT